MDKIFINGGKQLAGSVDISGAKNSCLPLLASSILFEDTVTFKNIPLTTDVLTMAKLLETLGSKVEISKNWHLRA